jgi:2-polyprenyl-3-methyl-5-hydroxy-6-metoxy-1,4-benzoquinol methylase
MNEFSEYGGVAGSADAANKNKNIDDVQEYWDRRPCNIQHSAEPVGTRLYFDQVERKKYFVEPHIPAFADFARWNGKRVLEIGCGIGTDSMNFIRAGAILTVVELSAVSLDIARKRFEIFGVADKVTVVHGNAEHLEDLLVDAGSVLPKFDLVYSFGVIHHSPDPSAILRGARALLNEDGGELRIMVYSKISYKLFFVMHHANRALKMGSADDVIRVFAEAQTGCPVAHTYMLEQASELVSSCGFEVLSATKDHIFTWDIDAYVRGEYVVADEWQGVPQHTIDAYAKELGWHTMVVARAK